MFHVKYRLCIRLFHVKYRSCICYFTLNIIYINYHFYVRYGSMLNRFHLVIMLMFVIYFISFYTYFNFIFISIFIFILIFIFCLGPFPSQAQFQPPIHMAQITKTLPSLNQIYLSPLKHQTPFPSTQGYQT